MEFVDPYLMESWEGEAAVDSWKVTVKSVLTKAEGKRLMKSRELKRKGIEIFYLLKGKTKKIMVNYLFIIWIYRLSSPWILRALSDEQ